MITLSVRGPILDVCGHQIMTSKSIPALKELNIYNGRNIGIQMKRE